MASSRMLITAAAALLLGATSVSRADEPLPVVASFSILGDMVKEIGGERVSVTTLVGPNGDAHVFQPAPADAAKLAAAKAVFVNGLHFEGWMNRLVESAGYTGPVVVASDGITALEIGEEDEHAHEGEGHGDEAHDHASEKKEEHAHDHDHEGEAHDHAREGEADHGVGEEHAGHHDHGGTDPHAWQSVANAIVYARNIEAGLAAADPDGAAVYAERSRDYVARLEALEAEVKDAIASIPENRRKVITSHDAFGYFAARYGLEFLAPQGVSTESEASAADVVRIIRQIRESQVPAIFVEGISDERLLAQISNETGARIGGVLFSDALSPPDGPAATYVDMMRHNVSVLRAALAP